MDYIMFGDSESGFDYHGIDNGDRKLYRLESEY